MNKKETAVDWLFSQLPDHLRLSRDGFDMIQQAKELEKEQIVNAYKNGVSGTKLAEQYYKETYTDKP